MSEESFQRALREHPDDQGLRLIFADWLDDRGDPRGDLLRLTHTLTRKSEQLDRMNLEAALRRLHGRGVRSIGPGWTNSIGMAFTWIPAGSLLLGSPADEPNRQDDETQHWVTLTRGFYMGIHPVTQRQWHTIMGNDPGHFRGDDRPVECVSWLECQNFCEALAASEGLGGSAGNPYRLPSEAEWEYTCRAGTSTAFFSGASLTPDQANFHTSSGTGERPCCGGTAPVGSHGTNAWGVADMHGNVFEWCSDWYGPYPHEPRYDPMGKAQGDVRVLRGGSWHSLVDRCRSACRGWGVPAYRGSDVGCRICFRMDHDFVL